MPEFTLPSQAAQPRVAALLACGQNLMAISWHMPVSKSPFRYAVAVRPENHTHALLRERGSFTLNFLPVEHYRAIDRMGRCHGDAFDKPALSGLEIRGTDPNGNLMLGQADFIYICDIIDEVSWGDHTLFISQVTDVRLHENPSGRLALFSGRGRYMTVGEIRQAPQEELSAYVSAAQA